MIGVLHMTSVCHGCLLLQGTRPDLSDSLEPAVADDQDR